MATAMRGYGGQNVMLMRNESSSDTLVAMLASCSPVGLQVPRSVGGLEDAVVGCGKKRPYYPTFDGSVDEPVDEDGGDDCSHNVEKKRRLTFDQVRSLERNFELENKLEPERKMQLAKELGLQPRQVAVWFQNRRARWKTKQLERDYEVLTLDYNRLKADFDVILQEKENLKAEIQRLSGKTEPKERQECESLEPTQSGSETTTHPSSLQPEVPMKTEHLSSRDYHARPSPTVDVLSSRKDKEQTTSSDSNSSEIMDAESPRTIDSNSLSTMPKEQSTNCTQFSPESFVDPSMLHVSDDFCGRALSNQVFNRGVVKLEDGSFHEDQSCNYFLTQLDEQGALPWWDWP